MNIKLRKILALEATTVLCCTFFIGCRKEGTVSNNNQPSQQVETPETSKSEASKHTISGDIISGTISKEKGPLELTKINVKEPNNTDKNGYKECKRLDGLFQYELQKEYIQAENLVPFEDENGTGLVLNTGHTVYVKPSEKDETESETTSASIDALLNNENSSDDFIIDDIADEQLQKCIISGEEVYNIDNYTYDIQYPNSFAQLRKEGTCERIYIYNSKDDYDKAIKNREDGQAILNGEKEPYENCVILNGSLVPNLKYSVNSDGRLCVSLRSLATAYDTNTNYDEDAHLLTIPIIYGDYVLIPSKNALPNISSYFAIDNKNNTFEYPSITFAPPWSDTFTLATTDDVIMPVEDISRILGWDFWYGDNVLKVVTDELDDTNPDNFVLEEKQTTTIYYELDELDGYDESESEADIQ